MITADRLAIAPEVADALASGTPVVALESTLISHGLAYPHNVEVATASEDAIRSTGAVPATVALNAGRLLVGLARDELEQLATAPHGSVRKVSRPNLAAAIASGEWGATTVAATMIAAHAAGIRVFSTGGIGGVHRGALTASSHQAASFDISADLDELARTPVAVVCAGPKAILDVPLTLEYLETRGVPVIALGIDEIPGFYSRRSGIPAPVSVPDVAAAADVIRAHASLGLQSGLVICNPVPEEDALDDRLAREAIDQAIREADHTGITGAAVTPWLLARVAAITDGASIKANVALIVNNAKTGGELALGGRATGSTRGASDLARRDGRGDVCRDRRRCRCREPADHVPDREERRGGEEPDGVAETAFVVAREGRRRAGRPLVVDEDRVAGIDRVGRKHVVLLGWHPDVVAAGRRPYEVRTVVLSS
jgi:pseudouridylate synthase